MFLLLVIISFITVYALSNKLVDSDTKAGVFIISVITLVLALIL